MSGIKEEMIELIKKNKISTTEVADCMGKTGLFENSHAVNRGHFAVGTVRWVYAYDNSNYTVHEQIRDTQPGDIVLIEAFNCGDRSTIGELVKKFIVLYKEAAAVITNGNLRDDANRTSRSVESVGIASFRFRRQFVGDGSRRYDRRRAPIVGRVAGSGQHCGLWNGSTFGDGLRFEADEHVACRVGETRRIQIGIKRCVSQHCRRIQGERSCIGFGCD